MSIHKNPVFKIDSLLTIRKFELRLIFNLDDYFGNFSLGTIFIVLHVHYIF